MAFTGLKEELNCSICLNIYTDPVSLACEHIFCRECIERALDAQEGCEVYSCPECRHQCRERPKLAKNRKLNNIAEIFSSAQLKSPETLCTYCINALVPAAKSCLLCEASLCGQHLKVHNTSAEHVLIDPVLNFDKVKCVVHNKVFMYYCSEDAACLCASCCLSPEHRNHDVKLLNESSDHKKLRFQKMMEKLEDDRNEVEKKIHCLQIPRKKLQEEATGLTHRVTSHFKDLWRQMGDLEKRILDDIRSQEKERSYGICDRIRQLEMKRDALSRKIRHIGELSNTADPVSVLQEPDACDAETDNMEDKTADDDMAQDLDEDIILMKLQTGLADIMLNAKSGIYTDNGVDILLDVNTAANNVYVSKDLKEASWLLHQGRPSTTERFQYHQVLSTESFNSGRLYWDVETSDTGNWMVGMAYPSIQRRGDQAIIGKNKASWSLCKWNNEYYALHDNTQTVLRVKTALPALRIYLDYEKGGLSFYELYEPTRLLHTFSATFTEPLHTAISVWDKAWVKVR